MLSTSLTIAALAFSGFLVVVALAAILINYSQLAREQRAAHSFLQSAALATDDHVRHRLALMVAENPMLVAKLPHSETADAAPPAPKKGLRQTSGIFHFGTANTK